MMIKKSDSYRDGHNDGDSDVLLVTCTRLLSDLNWQPRAGLSWYLLKFD